MLNDPIAIPLLDAHAELPDPDAVLARFREALADRLARLREAAEAADEAARAS